MSGTRSAIARSIASNPFWLKYNAVLWWQQLAMIALSMVGGLATIRLLSVWIDRGGDRNESTSGVVGIAMLVFAIGMLVRVVLVVCNEEFAFFEPKVAGDLSLRLYDEFVMTDGGVWQLFGEEFGPQVFLNTPAWWMFGPHRLITLLNNSAVAALAGPLAAVWLTPVVGRGRAMTIMFLMACYPALVNFSLFGLRDPIIFFAMVALACGMVRSRIAGWRATDVVTVLLASIIVFWSRPELAYVLVCLLGWPIASGVLTMVHGVRGNRRYAVNLMLLAVPLALVTVGAIAGMTQIAARNIGFATVNPFEIADEAASNRFERHAGSAGAGSHIVDSTSYTHMPVYVRVPMQTVGMIVVPFPWQIKGVAKAFAFADSCFLIAVLGWTVLQTLYSRPLAASGRGRHAMILLACFAIGILGMGFIVSNSGNAFRMRLSLTPLLFIAAAAVPISVRVSLFGGRASRLLFPRTDRITLRVRGLPRHPQWQT